MEKLKVEKNDSMSSLEIAQLTGKRHSDILNAIRKMEAAWVKVNERNFSFGSYLDKNNQSRPMYNLTKSESLYVATKFNDEARAKLILRWEELERSKTQELPSNYLEALKHLVEKTETNLALKAQNNLQEKQLKIQAPKVEYVNKVLQSTSTYTTNQIAKEFGMSARSLNRWLHEKKVQYKQNDTWLLYQKHQDKGYTKTKTYHFIGSDGVEKTSMSTVWLEKGRMFIHDLMKSERKAS